MRRFSGGFDRARLTGLTALVGLGVALLASAACTPQPSDGEDDDGTESSVAHVEVAPHAVVAEPAAAAAAETQADRVRIPLAVGRAYSDLAPGTIFVGGRGAADGKNPDGFLRQIDSASVDGDFVVLMTHPAKLTDAVVDGSVSTSSGARDAPSIDSNDLTEAFSGGFKLDLDFAKDPLFENIDEIVVAGKKTGFAESIRFDRAKLTAQRSVNLDFAIQGGKIARFLSKIEGPVDTSIAAIAEVKIDGDGEASDKPLPSAVRDALRQQKHAIAKVVYDSGRMPLPTFQVGNIPVSPSIQFTVTMRCDVSFGGPLLAHAGMDGKPSALPTPSSMVQLRARDDADSHGLVLHAHQLLADLSASNAEQFQPVIDALQRETPVPDRSLML